MAMCVVIGKPSPSVVWTDSASVSPAGFPTTFSGVAIGTAAADRLVFVATYRSTATGVTVGGITASLVADTGAGASLRLWVAAVPTGTTASIVVSNSSASGEMISVWAAYNYNSATPFDTSTFVSGANAFSQSCDVNTPSSPGFVIAVAVTSTAGVTTASWSGVTLDNNNNPGSPASIMSSASIETTSAETPRAVSVTWDVSALASVITASYS